MTLCPLHLSFFLFLKSKSRLFNYHYFLKVRVLVQLYSSYVLFHIIISLIGFRVKVISLFSFPLPCFENIFVSSFTFFHIFALFVLKTMFLGILSPPRFEPSTMVI